MSDVASSSEEQPSEEAKDFANELTRPIFEGIARGMVEAMDSTLVINDDATFTLASLTADVEPVVGIWSESDGVATFTFTMNGFAFNSTAILQEGSLRYTIQGPPDKKMNELHMMYVREVE